MCIRDSGELLYKVLNQVPGENYNFKEQTLMLDICLNFTIEEHINVEALKKAVREVAPQLADDDSNFDQLRDDIKKRSLIDEPKKDTKKEAPAADAAKPADAKPADKKDEKKDDKDEKKDDKKEEDKK